MKFSNLKLFSIMLAAVFAAFSMNGQGGSELLPPEKAFQVMARIVDARSVAIDYTIAPGYYLYRERFSFNTDNPEVKVVSVTMPEPMVMRDVLLATDVQYYERAVTARVNLSNADQPFRLLTVAQGCASVGVCYPPVSRAYAVPSRRELK